MRSSPLFCFYIATIFSLNSIAQQLPVPLNIKAAYDKGTRSLDGKPGKNYWQNTADYDLKINFDPATRLLNGSEEIVYINNSQDTLRPIFFKLYPNIFKKGSVRNVPVLPDDLTDGVKISSVVIDNKKIERYSDRVVPMWITRKTLTATEWIV